MLELVALFSLQMTLQLSLGNGLVANPEVPIADRSVMGLFLADQSLREKRKTNLHGANIMRLQSDSPMIRCAGLFRSDSPTIRCAGLFNLIRRLSDARINLIRRSPSRSSHLLNCDEKKTIRCAGLLRRDVLEKNPRRVGVLLTPTPLY